MNQIELIRQTLRHIVSAEMREKALKALSEIENHLTSDFLTRGKVKNAPKPEATLAALDALKYISCCVAKRIAPHQYFYDAVSVVEAAMQAPASDVPTQSINQVVLEALIDQIEVFKQRIHESIISKPQAITIETYDLLDYIVTSLLCATPADTFKIVQNLEQAIKDLDEDGEIDRHNEEAIEEAARAYFTLQVEHLKRQITKI